jgi:hypothetical protein
MVAQAINSLIRNQVQFSVGGEAGKIYKLALLRNERCPCVMDNYRVIVDGSTSQFAVEITHENGYIQTRGGFPTLLAAYAWMADRIAVAEASASYRAELFRNIEATDDEGDGLT